ncbi:hypothetical protein RJD24_14400 [Bacillaceae bacterium IKA-2]|nr:hypothetical protein RJD24_14400 [Bacillaceae bacterium IKA-2]
MTIKYSQGFNIKVTQIGKDDADFTVHFEISSTYVKIDRIDSM